MGINVTSLREIDPAPVAAAEKLLSSLIAAYTPDVDTTGALRSLLIRPQALLYTLARTEVDRLRRATSLKALIEDPALADPATVDAAMSNFAIRRHDAKKAVCTLTLTYSAPHTATIDTLVEFIAAGVLWRPKKVYTLVDTAQDVNEGELVFSAHPDNSGYWVQIDVEAAAPGAVYVESGTTFRFPIIDKLIAATAAAPAVGGRDAETNEALVARAICSVSPVSLATRSGLTQFITEYMPSIENTLITGFGDPELSRSRHNMFAVSTPGFSDVYVRTAPFPLTTSVSTRGSVRMTREQLSPDDNTTSLPVRVEVKGQAFAGAYEVAGIMLAPPTSSGITAAEALEQGLAYAVQKHERSIASAPEMFAPTPADAAFSAAQVGMYATGNIPLAAFSSVLQHEYKSWESYWQNWYKYTDASTSPADKITAHENMSAAQLALGAGSVSSEFYDEVEAWCWATYMPGLALLQQALMAPERQVPVNYLVRAFVPCNVEVGIRLIRRTAIADTTIDQVKQAIVRHIATANESGTGGIYAGDIAVVVSNVVGTAAALEMPITLTAKLRMPNDDILHMDSGSELHVPAGYENIGVSARTVAFYTTPYSIYVEVVNGR
jgi:hypothetical protein